MQAAETGRRINQLYNDVNAIYGLLNTIHHAQASHSGEIESIKSSLTDIRATQMRHDNRLSELGERLDSHDAKLTAIGGRLDTQDRKLDRILEVLSAN